MPETARLFRSPCSSVHCAGLVLSVLLPGLFGCVDVLSISKVEPSPPQSDAALPCAAEIDDGGDGFVDAREDYAYDADGQLEVRVHRRAEWTTTTTYAYDDAGRLIRETDQTPIFDLRSDKAYAYDDAGRQVLMTYQSGASAEPTWFLRSLFTGDETSPTREEGASTAEGEAEWVWTFTYDDAGNQVREAFTLTEPLDDFPYVIETAYDADGRRMSEVYDAEREVDNDHKTMFEYDAEGRLTRMLRDLGPDGEVDRVDSWTYDDDGALLEKEIDGARWTYQYDCPDDA